MKEIAGHAATPLCLLGEKKRRGKKKDKGGFSDVLIGSDEVGNTRPSDRGNTEVIQRCSHSIIKGGQRISPGTRRK